VAGSGIRLKNLRLAAGDHSVVSGGRGELSGGVPWVRLPHLVVCGANSAPYPEHRGPGVPPAMPAFEPASSKNAGKDAGVAT
jgi:hypothetical protein